MDQPLRGPDATPRRTLRRSRVVKGSISVPFPRHPLRALRSLVRRIEAIEANTSSIGSIASAVERSETLAQESRDTLALLARRQARGPGPTRVVFLVHHIEAWDSLHDLVAAMREADDFEPVVLSIPRRFKGSPGLVDEDRVHRGLEALGVPHLRLGSTMPGEALRFVKLLEPDVVFRQSQWDADIAPELAVDNLAFARLCLVPYETMNMLENVPAPVTGANTAVDSEYHRAAWLVFCANERTLDMARRDGALLGSQFRVVGHPKTRRLQEAVPDWPIEAVEEDRRRRIVWSAHHSIGTGWSDFGVFPQMAEDMLEWAKAEPSTDFVWSPHPALIPFTASSESPYSRAALDEWTDRWVELANTAILADGAYAPVLAASDLLVTDGLSMLVEYQVQVKPVIFVERRGHRPFNEIGREIMTGVHTVDSVAEARALAHDLFEGDPLADQQRSNVAHLLGDGDAVAKILDSLRAEVLRSWR